MVIIVPGTSGKRRQGIRRDSNGLNCLTISIKVVYMHLDLTDDLRIHAVRWNCSMIDFGSMLRGI